MMRPVRMVDLPGQYLRYKAEIDAAIGKVLMEGDFIQGAAVREFESDLSVHLDGASVVSCANGTDALQIAMMALGLRAGDEVILPVHTYVATAEVIALLGLTPVFTDVDPDTFTIDTNGLEGKITKRTKAIVPVHLYGQCAHMEPVMTWAKGHGLHTIEDAAQSLGAEYLFIDGSKKKAGTLGTVGATSFFPSKNLGAYGDGGALISTNSDLAVRMRMIANHGQREKYRHEVVGVNSRLDTMQAAILNVKLRYLGESTAKRRQVADYYDRHLAGVPFLRTPVRAPYSTHVFHQYTVVTHGIQRDQLRSYLLEHGIPTMIYYPIPLHLQPAYRVNGLGEGSFPVTEELSRSVLSLPIHTEMDEEQLAYICRMIQSFS